MDRPRAWVLNLDADDELASPRGDSPSAASMARLDAFATRAVGLVPPGDTVLAASAPPGRTGIGASAPRGPTEIAGSAAVVGTVNTPSTPRAGAPSRSGSAPSPRPLGIAWCPTPSAIRKLVVYGAEPQPAPDLAVLRRVNHRRFCAELGQTLPLARYVGARAELDAALAAAAPGSDWVLKRPFGFVGRGRRLVRAGALSEADGAWIEASLRRGEGLQAEPWVDRRADFAVHGHLAPGGALVLGAPTVQRCDTRGAWQESARAGRADLTAEEQGDLVAEATRVALALTSAGYFGPFGIDAFRWCDERGLMRFDPRCEINARYSMGWAIGMGDTRPDLELWR